MVSPWLAFALVYSASEPVGIVLTCTSVCRYNYEKLQQCTEIKVQKLIQPLCVDLTAAQELVVMDHLEVFEMNGFEFSVDQEVFLCASERHR